MRSEGGWQPGSQASPRAEKLQEDFLLEEGHVDVGIHACAPNPASTAPAALLPTCQVLKITCIRILGLLEEIAANLLASSSGCFFCHSPGGQTLKSVPLGQNQGVGRASSAPLLDVLRIDLDNPG